MAADAAEPALVRHVVEAPAALADALLGALLDVFPGGLEELEPEAGRVGWAGYAPAAEPPRLDGLPAGASVRSEPVAPGWLDGWRAFHRPARVGRFWIGPPWLEPDPDLEAVVIEPGHAFGTGAHGSTRAAAALLGALEPAGALLDVGCGSGVLAILAVRLGWAPVTAVDLDPLAIAAARDNVARADAAIELAVADALSDPLPSAALWLANLEQRLLVPLFAGRDDIPARVIVSGLLVSERFEPAGYAIAAREEADGWQALLLERVVA